MNSLKRQRCIPCNSLGVIMVSVDGTPKSELCMVCDGASAPSGTVKVDHPNRGYFDSVEVEGKFIAIFRPDSGA